MRAYVGNLSWNQVELDLQRDVPLRFDLSTKFVLHRDSFELDELVWKTLHSELNLRAELPSFARAEWNMHYRGRLSLEDVRKIFREPLTPDLIADFSGEARYASGDWTGSGHFDGHDVKMPYEWFHATNIETTGNYTIAKKKLVVENLAIRALEGSLDGHLEMDLPTLAFRTQTHFHHASLAEAIHAVNNTDFPIDTLHWDGGIDVDSYNTWTANFKHFTTKGESRWSPPAVLTPGMIPVTARIFYDYSEDSENFALTDSEITTPNTQIEFSGRAQRLRYHAGIEAGSAEPGGVGRFHQPAARRRCGAHAHCRQRQVSRAHSGAHRRADFFRAHSRGRRALRYVSMG